MEMAFLMAWLGCPLIALALVAYGEVPLSPLGLGAVALGMLLFVPALAATLFRDS